MRARILLAPAVVAAALLGGCGLTNGITGTFFTETVDGPNGSDGCTTAVCDCTGAGCACNETPAPSCECTGPECSVTTTDSGRDCSGPCICDLFDCDCTGDACEASGGGTVCSGINCSCSNNSCTN